jgi:hypothetical protein
LFLKLKEYAEGKSPLFLIPEPVLYTGLIGNPEVVGRGMLNVTIPAKAGIQRAWIPSRSWE